MASSHPTSTVAHSAKGNEPYSPSANARRKASAISGHVSPPSLRTSRTPPPPHWLSRPHPPPPPRRGAPCAGSPPLTPAPGLILEAAHTAPALRRNLPPTCSVCGCPPPRSASLPIASARRQARHSPVLSPALSGAPWRSRTTDDAFSSALVPRRTTHVETRGLHNCTTGGVTACVIAACVLCVMHLSALLASLHSNS